MSRRAVVEAVDLVLHDQTIRLKPADACELFNRLQELLSIADIRGREYIPFPAFFKWAPCDAPPIHPAAAGPFPRIELVYDEAAMMR